MGSFKLLKCFVISLTPIINWSTLYSYVIATRHFNLVNFKMDNTMKKAFELNNGALMIISDNSLQTINPITG